MLRLLAAGLVTSADGRVFRRRFVLELLMSFAGSAMADAFTRRLVMQVSERCEYIWVLNRIWCFFRGLSLCRAFSGGTQWRTHSQAERCEYLLQPVRFCDVQSSLGSSAF